MVSIDLWVQSGHVRCQLDLLRPTKPSQDQRGQGACIAFYGLHCFALLCIALYCFALFCIALHCLALLCIALLCIALHCFALHCFACIALLWGTWRGRPGEPHSARGPGNRAPVMLLKQNAYEARVPQGSLGNRAGQPCCTSHRYYW